MGELKEQVKIAKSMNFYRKLGPGPQQFTKIFQVNIVEACIKPFVGASLLALGLALLRRSEVYVKTKTPQIMWIKLLFC